MGKAHSLFQNFEFTASETDQGRPISFTQDWLGIVINVSDVGAGSSAKFTLQWSHDGQVWFTDTNPPSSGKKKDPPAEVMADVAGPGAFIRSTPIKACFWRIVADVSNTSGIPSVTASGTVMA